jgi:uncharacterized protein (DUF2384 family)
MHKVHIRFAVLSPFLESITDQRLGVISPQRVCEALHMTQAELARLTKLHRNTLAHPASPAVQAQLGEVALMIGKAADLLDGDTGRAVVWFRYQPLAGFDGQTAAELTASGQGEAVLAHLDMLRDGVYA